ncbi:flagellar hook-associated protein FlgL [Agromyces mediolanus]|jgi:flagellar hook-associated protein 3 FlgL|uniref:flagellar hook-associated protein FlgL n=1 Tax=Agromyces mediolanus TaxID=41986 RepID=UPI001E2EAAB8|nr:flagellar hook-associated protein FlgL [Agromyces mediolanus]MCD1573193.1 flagellar hook-associated protein FlgL [Agromyces mediolanus]
MMNRVTTMSIAQSSARNLQLAASQLARAQQRATDFKAITKPSDDPAATARAMQVRAEQRANLQYARNIQDGNAWLSTIDSALQSTTSLLGRARDLTLQGANDGALSQTQKDAIAAELDAVRDLLLAQANSSYAGRQVFAGTSDQPAFDASYAFSGGAGTVERRVDAGTTVRVDVDGSSVFGVGADSVFATIDRIAAGLRAGTPVGAELSALDVHRSAVLDAHAAAGARHATVLQSVDRNLAQKIDLEATRSRLEDIDVATAAIELSTSEIAHQAALAATARAVRPTLMDYLR